MKRLWTNYKSSIILLISIIIGGILGLIFKDSITCLKSLGDLFINLLMVVIVPIIFLSISTSIGKMKSPKRIGKVLIVVALVFLVTSLISACIGVVSSSIFNFVGDSTKLISSGLENSSESVNYLEKFVSVLSVSNFSDLLNTSNIIALIVVSCIFGLAINLSGEKGKDALKVLDSFNEVVQKCVKIIMYYAPVGLGVYFAVLVGTFGENIAYSYLRMLGIYVGVSLIVYFGLYTFYAYVAGGKTGVKKYWLNILPPTITALATCSSAASIPVNTEAARKIGVSNDIASSMIPLGTNFHKDGSIIGSAFKIMFLVYLFNLDISVFSIIGIALLATLLVTALPIGGGTISEMLIITSLGVPVSFLPILTVIATIIDAPATVLNVVGDTASSMIASRIIDGENWLN